jgi:ABC-type uncharacterized transport system involved in gliding motility auxiliary subunit
VTESPSKALLWRARTAQALRCIAALALAVWLAWFSTRSPVSLDMTKAQTHTLSAISLAVLANIDEPITVTAFVPPNSPRRAQLEPLIDRYRRHQPTITFEFVDPASEPERVRAEEIRNGELIIRSGARTERTAVYSEQTLTEALARLARSEDRWIVFITGHGERSPRRGANHDVSDWANVLEKRGFNVQEINLAEFRAVPDNASVLVIASPQVDFQTLETAAVVKYLAGGGNLLWLTDPDRPVGFSALERAVGFSLIPGTIVDPVSLAHGVDNPAFVLLNHYANHPSLAGFNYTTVMFYAVGINARAPDGWAATRLILSGEKAWSETEALDGNVGYDDGADFLGPLPIAIALSRQLAEHQQLVVVVGDGDFLANAYLQNSGNQDLGVRLLEWLSHDDRMIAVPTRAAEDIQLELKDWHKAVIGFGFLVGLPGAFALNGVFIWWRRRRA